MLCESNYSEANNIINIIDRNIMVIRSELSILFILIEFIIYYDCNIVNS